MSMHREDYAAAWAKARAWMAANPVATAVVVTAVVVAVVTFAMVR